MFNFLFLFFVSKKSEEIQLFPSPKKEDLGRKISKIQLQIYDQFLEAFFVRIWEISHSSSRLSSFPTRMAPIFNRIFRLNESNGQTKGVFFFFLLGSF
mmetsp:Transcript_15079/g.16751  ORF Transcript_15079/g.16751 Transcript_15079/m.16751 type:complete len:98 (-) Transcript_15079:992-1285(-)